MYDNIDIPHSASAGILDAGPVMNDNDAPAVSVQILREMRGLSLIELANLAGMLPDHVRAIEAGLQPTMPERQALAAALDIPPESIG